MKGERPRTKQNEKEKSSEDLARRREEPLDVRQKEGD